MTSDLVRYVAAALRWVFFSRQRQYITVKRLDTPPVQAPALRPDIECLMVDSEAALQAVGWEMPATFRDSAADLGKRVARGCVVCLARRKRDDGDGHEVVGYELSEPGVFSAMGRRIPVAEDIIFSHYAEVLPAYRGQRIHGLMFAARDAYFRKRGARIVCGVCLPRNLSSLAALRRDGADVVGTVHRVALFRGRLVWDTPADRIYTLLRDVSVARESRSGRPARALRSTAV